MTKNLRDCKGSASCGKVVLSVPTDMVESWLSELLASSCQACACIAERARRTDMSLGSMAVKKATLVLLQEGGRTEG